MSGKLNRRNVRQFRAALGWNNEAGLSAKIGVQYIDDELYQESTSTFTNGVFASRSGYGVCSGRAGGSGGSLR